MTKIPKQISQILTVNTGSSSVRLACFRLANDRFQAKTKAAVDPSDPNRGLANFTATAVDAVVHRVVHGGTRFTAPCRIDAAVEAEIEALSALAPLHHPKALAWIRASREVFGEDVPQIAVFDTAFFANLPEVARTYALPSALMQDHGLRRYGFHGLAHQSMWQDWCRCSGHQTGRVITLQLGSGCSITATRDGVAQDTSMGFTPLEGLMMATRSGDLDPGLLCYLQRECGMTLDEIEHVLSRESGLLGVSGLSGDMRALLDSNVPAAKHAVALYVYRARKYVGAYLAVLGGAEAIVFGGGVGEHAPRIRARILAGLEWAGIHLDADRNQAAIEGEPICISAPDSRIAAWVLPVEESRVMADKARAILNASIPVEERSQA